ncbi:MAG: hypothetical protein WKG06_26265 [Segetibacter sp.]
MLKLPEVITPSNEVLTDEDWTGFEEVLISAVDQLKEHRADEGKSLEEELSLRIENILIHAEKIADLEPLRQTKNQRWINKNSGR